MSIVCFDIRGKWFGVPLEKVEGLHELSTVTAIPGNKSRVLLGLAYILGQIMSVVDCAPLFNLSTPDTSTVAVIVQHKEEYYAIKASSVGEILTRTRMKRFKKPPSEVTVAYLMSGKKKIVVIDIETLIGQYVCS